MIEGGDYSLYWTNPDVLVDWKLVEQIVSCYNLLIVVTWNILRKYELNPISSI